MGFKKTKLAVASLVLASLTACTANRGANVNDVNNTAYRPQDATTRNLNPVNYRNDPLNYGTRIGYNRDNFSNVNNVGTRDYLMDMNGQGNRGNKRFNTTSTGNLNLNSWNTTTEIQPSNNGFITITPNSYSTDTPSAQFPHTRRVNQGNFWYYTFEPAGQGPNGAQQTGNNTVMPQSRTQTGTQGLPTQTGQTTQPSPAPTAQAPAGISQMAQQVIDLTNNERRKNGLPPLQADASLSRVAQTKTNDMQAKHYFSHTSPTYGSPFDMMRDFGVSYRSAGENIAMGQTTAQQVVTAWMNSEGHRKNILSSSFTNIGVGFNSNGNYWSQMFIGK